MFATGEAGALVNAESENYKAVYSLNQVLIFPFDKQIHWKKSPANPSFKKYILRYLFTDYLFTMCLVFICNCTNTNRLN